MRLPLSRLTAVLVMGIALAAVPGVAVSRAGGREGTARMATRGGLQRLSTSEAVVLAYDDTAPDTAAAGSLVSGSSDSTALRDAGSTAGLPPAPAGVVPPPVGSILLDALAPFTIHPAGSFLRPVGRAPPAR